MKTHLKYVMMIAGVGSRENCVKIINGSCSTLFYTHDGSMYGIFIYMNGCFFAVNGGKYTNPMDPM